jgi:hypothetical protein
VRRRVGQVERVPRSRSSRERLLADFSRSIKAPFNRGASVKLAET